MGLDAIEHGLAEMGAQLTLPLSAFSLVVAIVALFFSVYAWREANRPLVSARVSTHGEGNVNFTLDLIIENTGNQPAINVRLSARRDDLRKALTERWNGTMPEDVQRCFFSDVRVPVLANGRAVTNAFGYIGHDPDATWQRGSELPITITYKDLRDRTFEQEMVLLLANTTGFAQTSWHSGPS